MKYRRSTPLRDTRLRHVDLDFFIHLYDIHPIQTAATATTSEAMATPVSIPGVSPPEDDPPPLLLFAFPPEDELSPLLLLTFPLVLVDSDVDSDVGAAAVAAGEEEPIAVLALVEVAIVDGVVSAGADAGTYPACEQ